MRDAYDRQIIGGSTEMLQNLTPQQLRALELLGQIAGTEKAVSSTPTTTYGHGIGGLFSAPGLDQILMSSLPLPRTGLQARLSLQPSVYTHPLYGIVTGQTATSGSEPTAICDDAPTAGLLKLCSQTAPFGLFQRSSRVFEVGRAGQVTNRGESLDFRIVGLPNTDSPNMPTIPGANFGQAAQTEVVKALFELGVAWIRDFARKVYTGNTTNNTSGGYKEYYGLDVLLNTGYRDAETGTACAAADSIVVSFGGANISTNGSDANKIVRTITNIFRRLNINAQFVGLAPLEIAISMRPNLFYELTEVWPIAYHTYRNTISTSSQTTFNNGKDLTDMRDAMREGSYLLIDGKQVEVVQDDAIAETGNFAAGAFRSDIYFVPMTVLGGTPVTYMEYYKYDQPNGSMDMARAFGADGFYFTSDDGRFMWHRKPPTNWCVQMQARTEPRLVVRTPYLGARLTNVNYTPLAHERDVFTSDTYFVNGGKTDRLGYGPSYYSPTS